MFKVLLLLSTFIAACHGFATPSARNVAVAKYSAKDTALFMSEQPEFGSDEATQDRIKALVNDNPVLLFMKGR